jgi:hypothetical protein
MYNSTERVRGLRGGWTEQEHWQGTQDAEARWRRGLLRARVLFRPRLGRTPQSNPPHFVSNHRALSAPRSSATSPRVAGSPLSAHIDAGQECAREAERPITVAVSSRESLRFTHFH